MKAHGLVSVGCIYFAARRGVFQHEHNFSIMEIYPRSQRIIPTALVQSNFMWANAYYLHCVAREVQIIYFPPSSIKRLQKH
jgi:hypothetical protein